MLKFSRTHDQPLACAFFEKKYVPKEKDELLPELQVFNIVRYEVVSICDH